MLKIGLIDYGMGNIHSVTKALQNLDEEIVLIKSNSQIRDCKALVLPGVGSFKPAMNNLKNTGLIDDIKKWFISECGCEFIGITKSPIKGPKGNIEFLIYCEKL